MADAGHSVSDILSDVVTFSTIYLGTLSPSPRFPYGRAALDSIGGLTVSGLLFSGSLAMGWHSLQGIMALQEHTHGDELLSGAALAVAAGTILSKEALFRYTLREARRTGQTVLVASAWHHRSDSLCTAVALMGIGGSLLTGLHWVDPLAGCVYSNSKPSAMLTPKMKATCERHHPPSERGQLHQTHSRPPQLRTASL